MKPNNSVDANNPLFCASQGLRQPAWNREQPRLPEPPRARSLDQRGAGGATPSDSLGWVLPFLFLGLPCVGIAIGGLVRLFEWLVRSV